MSGKKTRFKLHKSHKRWMVIGVSAIALLGGLMQAKPVHAALNSVGTVNYVKGWNTVVWQRNNGMHMTNNWLPTNSRWRTYGAVQTDDKQYFLNVGGNQWVGDKYFDLDDETSWQTLRGVVTISDAPNEGTPVWNSPYADRIQTDHQPLKNGSRWQTYLRAVVNGQTWYNLGGKQWIQGSSAQITQEQLRGPKHYISGAPSLIDGGGTNVAVKTHYSVVAKDVYGNVLQTNFFTANVGDRAYINAPTIPGYDVLAPSSQSIVLGNDTNQNEIIFKYTPHYAPPTPPIKPTQTTVHIRFVDSDGNTITTVDQDATIGGQFNYQAPKEFQHDGKTYQLVGDGKINLPNVTGNERPTVEYQLQTPIPATTSVTVRAVDSDGKVLDGDLATVDVNNDQLAGYEYTLKPGQQTITIGDTQYITKATQAPAIQNKDDGKYYADIVYTAVPKTTTVTVRAVDSDGKVLDGDLATVDVNNDQLAGYEYTLKPGQQTITIGDTQYTTTATQAPAIQNKDDGKYYADIVYTAVPKTTTVTVRAVDSDGKVLDGNLATVDVANDQLAGYEYTLKPGQQTITIGDTQYTTTATQAPAIQNKDDGKYYADIVYTAVPKTTTVTVRAVDSDGKVLDGNLATVDVANDQLAGYEYTLKPGQQTITIGDTQYTTTATQAPAIQNKDDGKYYADIVYTAVPKTTTVTVRAVDSDGKVLDGNLATVDVANDQLAGYEYTLKPGQQTITIGDTQYTTTATQAPAIQNKDDGKYYADIVYTAVPKTTTVTVRAVDSDGKVLDGNLATVDVANDQLAGYEYTLKPGQQTITIGDTQYTTTATQAPAIQNKDDGKYYADIVYTAVPKTTTVTVRAVDSDGKVLDGNLATVDVANDQLAGYEYTLKPGQQTITIGDTQYTTTATQAPAIQNKDDGKYYADIVYTAVPKTTTVTVRAVDSDGKVLDGNLATVDVANDQLAGYEYTLKPGQQTITIGDTQYTTTATQAPAIQNKDDGKYYADIVYTAVPKTTTVTVRAVDSDGKVLDGNLATVDVANDQLAGYEYTLKPGQQTITIGDTQYTTTATQSAAVKNEDGKYYADIVYMAVPKTTTVTVRAVDSDGKVLDGNLATVDVANDQLAGYTYTLKSGQQTITIGDTQYTTTATQSAAVKNEDGKYYADIVYTAVPVKKYTVTVNAIDRAIPTRPLVQLYTEQIPSGGTLDYTIPKAMQDYTDARTDNEYKLVDPETVHQTNITKNTTISVQYALQITLNWYGAYTYTDEQGDRQVLSLGLIHQVVTNQSSTDKVSFTPAPEVTFDNKKYKLLDPTQVSTVSTVNSSSTQISYVPDTTESVK